MKKNICIILIYTLAGILFFLLSYMVENNIKYKPKILMDSIKEISMKIVDIKENILTVEITDNTEKHKDLWSYHRIEKNTSSGWQSLDDPNLRKNVKTPVSVLDDNNKLIKQLNLQSEYGNLEKGTYRLISTVKLYEYAQDYEFSAEFKVP